MLGGGEASFFLNFKEKGQQVKPAALIIILVGAILLSN